MRLPGPLRERHNREQIAFALMVLSPIAALVLAALVAMCSGPNP